MLWLLSSMFFLKIFSCVCLPVAILSSPLMWNYFHVVFITSLYSWFLFSKYVHIYLEISPLWCHKVLLILRLRSGLTPACQRSAKYLITAAQVRLCVVSMQTSYKPAILLHPFSLSPPADSPWARSVRCWCLPCSSAPCCGSCSSSPCAWSSSSSSRTTAGCLSRTARCPPQPKSGWSVWLLLLLLLFFQSVFFCFYLCLV